MNRKFIIEITGDRYSTLHRVTSTLSQFTFPHTVPLKSILFLFTVHPFSLRCIFLFKWSLAQGIANKILYTVYAYISIDYLQVCNNMVDCLYQYYSYTGLFIISIIFYKQDVSGVSSGHISTWFVAIMLTDFLFLFAGPTRGVESGYKLLGPGRAQGAPTQLNRACFFLIRIARKGD
jgi:hypothetical protein